MLPFGIFAALDPLFSAANFLLLLHIYTIVEVYLIECQSLLILILAYFTSSSSCFTLDPFSLSIRTDSICVKRLAASIIWGLMLLQ